MGIPLDDDWNMIPVKPKEAKGGVFAPADIKLIKEAITQYAQNSTDEQVVKQVVSLLHRLNRISS
jgi:sRNA-binding carbon storage regulator CsrA